MSPMKLVTVLLPEKIIEYLDDLVRLNIYSSRSAAIRSATRDLVTKERYLVLHEGDRGPRT